MSTPVGPGSVQATFGPLLIGLALSIGLQGILVAQTYLYWKSHCNRDSHRFRLLVFGLLALEFIHCAVAAHAGYWYLILNYNRPAELDILVWSIIVEIALTVLITFIGRAFWIVWLFMLSRKNRWLTSVTSAFSLMQLGLGIAEVYESARMPLASTISGGKAVVISQMLSADLGDAIISIALCHYLHTSRSGIRKTELLIDRLVLFTVTRGVLVVGSGALQLITYAVWPKTFIFGTFHLIASKLYTNALLATLNSRDHLAGPITEPSETPGTGTSFVLSSLANDTQINRAFAIKTQRSPDSTIHSADHNYVHAHFIATSSSTSSLPVLESKAHVSLTLMHAAEEEDPAVP